VNKDLDDQPNNPSPFSLLHTAAESLRQLKKENEELKNRLKYTSWALIAVVERLDSSESVQAD